MNIIFIFATYIRCNYIMINYIIIKDIKIIIINFIFKKVQRTVFDCLTFLTEISMISWFYIAFFPKYLFVYWNLTCRQFLSTTWHFNSNAVSRRPSNSNDDVPEWRSPEFCLVPFIENPIKLSWICDCSGFYHRYPIMLR